MVLRCSLLGHDFGDADIEREREERGSEVVVTVQEYEECTRCGERNVISENTEVTSLSAGMDADSLPDEPDTEPPEPPEQSSESDAAPIDDSEEDVEFIDADDPDDPDDAAVGAPDPTAEGTPAADPSTSPAGSADDTPAATDDPSDAPVDLPTDENGDPVTDDGEILEDDDEPGPAPDSDREHGEWPNSNDVGPPAGEERKPANWPDDGPDDAPATADDATDSSATDDAVVLESDGPADRGDDIDGAATDARSVTAEPPTQEADESAPDTASDPETGIERAESVSTPVAGDSAPAEDVPTEFYCPRCEYVAAGDRGSLRAGDICPDCRKGYLSERERR